MPIWRTYYYQYYHGHMVQYINYDHCHRRASSRTPLLPLTASMSSSGWLGPLAGSVITQEPSNDMVSSTTTPVGGGDGHSITTFTNVPRRTYRCLVIGDANCGKTSLLRRYIYGTYNEELSPSSSSTRATIGLDYMYKDIPVIKEVLQQQQQQATDGVESVVNDLGIASCSHDAVDRICFIDVGGQPRFRPLMLSLLNRAHLVIIVVSLGDDDRTIISNIQSWKQIVKHHASHIPIMCIGTKQDLFVQQNNNNIIIINTNEQLPSLRDPTTTSAESSFADDNTATSILKMMKHTSAKTGLGVDDAFESIMYSLQQIQHAPTKP